MELKNEKLKYELKNGNSKMEWRVGVMEWRDKEWRVRLKSMGKNDEQLQLRMESKPIKKLARMASYLI